jgi:hypothetical protein
VGRKRKESGCFAGNNNPSKKMTKEQLIERGKKSAETKRLNGKTSAILFMAWEYKNVRRQFYWGA